MGGDPRDGIGGSIDRIHHQRLIGTVVYESDLLTEDVQRDLLTVDVHECGILRHLVYLGGRGTIGTHAHLLTLALGIG